MICRQIVCMLSTQRSSSCVCPGFAAKRAETALIEQAQKRAEHDGGPFRGKCCFFVVLLLFCSSPLFWLCSFAEFVVGTSSTAAANAPAPADAHWCISSTQSDSARNGSNNELHIKILNFGLHKIQCSSGLVKTRFFNGKTSRNSGFSHLFSWILFKSRDFWKLIERIQALNSPCRNYWAKSWSRSRFCATLNWNLIEPFLFSTHTVRKLERRWRVKCCPIKNNGKIFNGKTSGIPGQVLNFA